MELLEVVVTFLFFAFWLGWPVALVCAFLIVAYHEWAKA